MEIQRGADVQEDTILIDWLTVVLHDVTVQQVKVMLGLDAADIEWEDRLAFRHGYPRQCGFSNICIRYGADDVRNYQDTEKSSAVDKVRFDMGICLDMSGSACRAFETYGHGDWFQLLADICKAGSKVHFTRLNLAFDDHSGILSLDRIRMDVEDRNFTGSPQKAKVVWSDDQKEDIQGVTVYIGSDKSAVMIRIYDKAAERGYKDRHWVRVEMQLRLDRALVAVAEIQKEKDVGRTFSGVLRNYCCFREPNNDRNKSRWPIAAYWDKLINGVSRISLWISPGEPYNFRKTEEHMIYQYGQVLQAYQAIHGNIYDLLEQSKQRHPDLKKKYKVAISEARKAEELAKQRVKEELDALRDQLGLIDTDDGWYLHHQLDMAEVYADLK